MVIQKVDIQNNHLKDGNDKTYIQRFKTIEKIIIKVYCLTILQNAYLAFSSLGDTINILDISNGFLKYTLKGHTASVCCLIVLHNGD